MRFVPLNGSGAMLSFRPTQHLPTQSGQNIVQCEQTPEPDWVLKLDLCFNHVNIVVTLSPLTKYSHSFQFQIQDLVKGLRTDWQSHNVVEDRCTYYFVIT